ncbi:MAG TPA: OB-fold domain-containing protein [Mycobacteriales bacterium]|nr:OB-fold domain-containing protein [Mycobacteriales bacterium]
MTETDVRSMDLRPRPEPNETNAFFWDAAAGHQLVLQRCDACSQFQYPPDVACVHCQCTELTPTEMSGRATLYSYAVVDRLFHVGFASVLPYVVGLAELDEQAGLRMLTNIVDTRPEEVQIGMPLEVCFEDRGEITLPQFRPRGDA